MKVFFTGGAGFIGSHMTEFLISKGHHVTVFDNLSTGSLNNLKSVQNSPNFKFVQADITDTKKIEETLPGHDLVIHFCDNSDIQFAASHPETYINQNIISLFHILETMKKNGIKKIIFPSSTTVFGDALTIPTPENYGPMLPLNIYGSAKMACEALLSGYAHTFDLQVWLYRFVGIVGPRMDHGVIRDFIGKLSKNPKELLVLGNGEQQRNFLIVEDCIDAIWSTFNDLKQPINLVHIGNVDCIAIKEVAHIVRDVMGLPQAEIKMSGGPRGWKGDSLSNMISCETLDKMGWKPKISGARNAARSAAERIFQSLKQH